MPARKARLSGLGFSMYVTLMGPSERCQGEPRYEALFSERRKYGSTSRWPQPVLPAWAQSSKSLG